MMIQKGFFKAIDNTQRYYPKYLLVKYIENGLGKTTQMAGYH